MIQFKCPGCGEEFSVENSLAGKVTVCNVCGEQTWVPSAAPSSHNDTVPAKRPVKLFAGVLTALVVFAAIWVGQSVFRDKAIQDLHNQVTTDLVKQYEIAKRRGSAMDAYVHAGAVAEAYLQAKDEGNYQKWKAIAQQEGVRAGMPQ